MEWLNGGTAELRNARNFLKYGMYGIFQNTEKIECFETRTIWNIYTEYSKMRDERKVF